MVTNPHQNTQFIENRACVNTQQDNTKCSPERLKDCSVCIYEYLDRTAQPEHVLIM